MSEPLSTLTEQERQLVMPDGTTVRPWAWYDDGPGSPYLATVKHGRTYVMGFARKGMNQAQPMFQVRAGRKYGVMQTAQEIGPDWPKHPDAALIVKAVNDYDRLRAIEAAARVLADAVDEGFDGWAARIPNPGQRRRIVQAADALRESFR
jgi:hypothetical protein